MRTAFAPSAKKPETQEDDILLGDINGDGTVNAMDTNLLKRVLAGVLTPDENYRLCGH